MVLFRVPFVYAFPSPFVLYTATELARTAGQLAQEVSACDAHSHSSGS